ncbi:MAG: hypothetical protein ACLSA6_07430 [Holdemania massiliensis]
MEVKYKRMLAAGGQLAGMAYLISGYGNAGGVSAGNDGCCAGFIPE